jgi:predicted O-methyltransferase YrrM
MTWRRQHIDGSDSQPVPPCKLNFGHLVEGLTCSDAPTGPMSLVMACIIYYCSLKTVVELGVCKGGTTVFLANAVKENGGVLYAIDKNECHEARERLERLGLAAPYCYFLQGKTNEVNWQGFVSGDWIDLLFIDAGHTYEEFKADWERWTPWVRSHGGWVFADNAWDQIGVRNYLLELKATQEFRDAWEYICVPESYGMLIARRK